MFHGPLAIPKSEIEFFQVLAASSSIGIPFTLATTWATCATLHGSFLDRTISPRTNLSFFWPLDGGAGKSSKYWLEA